MDAMLNTYQGVGADLLTILFCIKRTVHNDEI